MSSATWVLPTLGYAWWAAGLETFSAESTAAVLGGGLAAVAWGTWRRYVARPVTEARSSRHEIQRWSLGAPGLLVWVPFLVLLAVFQLAMYTNAPREEYPTISSILNGVLSSHGARSLACALWLAGAAWLARRPGTEHPEGRP